MGGFGGGRDMGNGGNSGPSARSAMTSNAAYGGTKSKSKTTSSTNNREDNRTTQRYSSTQLASGKAKVQADIVKDNATAFNDMKYEGTKAPSLLLQGLEFLGLNKKAFDVNKAYYEKNIVGKNNFTKSPEDFKSYLSKRGSGEIDAMGRPKSTGGNSDIKQGIELAKSATGSATILSPGEIQKTAANTKGLTDVTMSAAQTNVANKRKGRRATNFTAKKTLDKNYTLSKKSLLG